MSARAGRIESGMEKYCVLEEGKLCDGCGQCRMCDLDPEKVCDNCMRCLKSGADYAQIAIDAVILEEEDVPEEYRE